MSRCAAFKCGAKIPPTFLMCRRHWAMVPQPLKDAIWAAYRSGNRDESLELCMQATKAVLDAEKARAEGGKLDAEEIVRRGK